MINEYVVESARDETDRQDGHARPDAGEPNFLAMGPRTEAPGERTTEPVAPAGRSRPSSFRARGRKERSNALATPSSPPRRAILDLSDEREQARSLALKYLLQARRRAVFELLSSLGDATSPSEVRVGLWAAALLREGTHLPLRHVSRTERLDCAADG